MHWICGFSEQSACSAWAEKQAFEADRLSSQHGAEAMTTNSQSIKIAAAITAAPRWAISLMPADGAPFPWSSSPWFEIVSGVISLAFAVVEIWATAYIMQAWHEAQSSGDVKLARNLRRLWVGTLAVLAVALVPPMYANVMRVNVNTFAPPVVLAWLGCVAASTFLVIGGVGYADKPSAQQEAKPAKAEHITEAPAVLVPHVEPQVEHAQPLRPLTRDDIAAIWNEHGHGGFEAVAGIARETLNGRSAALSKWYTTPQPKISTLVAALGVDGQDAKNVAGWVKFRNVGSSNRGRDSGQ